MSFGEDRRFDFPRFSVTGLDLGRLPRGGQRRPARGRGRRGGRRQFSRRLASRNVPRHPRDRRHGAFGVSSPRPWRHARTSPASLQAPGGLRLDRWLPAAPRSGAGRAGDSRRGASPATGSERLTNSLRALDATLTLTTPAVAWGRYALGMVELSARLDRGVLDVTRLAGTLEGAAFDLKARVDARAAVPAMEVGGSVRNIDISRTIAVAGAANEFGTDQARGGTGRHARPRGPGLESRGRYARRSRRLGSGPRTVAKPGPRVRRAGIGVLRLVRDRTRQPVQHRDGFHLGGSSTGSWGAGSPRAGPSTCRAASWRSTSIPCAPRMPRPMSKAASISGRGPSTR